MEFLPIDLSEEIFVRLPCKDILSCKCVCRAWYNLLSHPDFTRNYARNSPFTSLLLIQSCNFIPSAFLLEFTANGGFIKTALEPKIPDTQQITSSFNVIGSCNGLLFFWLHMVDLSADHVTEKLYCCNPLLGGRSVMLAENGRQFCSGIVDYKIGYISSTNKYKMLRILLQPRRKREQADVFTVGIDREWRRVADDHWNFAYDKRDRGGVSFNGTYLWIFMHESGQYLGTFDFAEERGGWKSKLPDSMQTKRRRYCLAVLNNQISAIDVSHWHQVAIWTMEEYGVAESWSRKMVIGSDWPLHRPYVFELNAVAALPNGDILFSDFSYNGIIMSLNPEKAYNEIKLRDENSGVVRTLHAAEFAPRFYSLGEDMSGRQCWHGRGMWARIFRFCRIVLGRFLCVKGDWIMKD